MNLIESVKLAITSLRANLMRSLLTMLGIIIGITSVIAIMTVGDGLANSVNSSMSDIGASNITLFIGQKDTDSISSDGESFIRKCPNYSHTSKCNTIAINPCGFL